MSDEWKSLNPWFDIWLKPRAVVRQELSKEFPKIFFIAIWLGGIASGLDRASLKSMGNQYDFSMILIFAPLGGMIGAIISFFIWSWLTGVVGRWFGGHANTKAMRTAISLCSIPLAWSLLIWAMDLQLFGMDNFTTATPRLDNSLTLAFAFLGTALLSVILGIWAIVIMTKAVGEAHGVSAWKGLGIILISFLIVFVVIFSAAFIFLLFMMM